MIKINKDLTLIPDSLKPPTVAFFPAPLRPHRQSKTTHLRRMEVINQRKYFDLDRFNSRYKLDDIKTELNLIYNHKCAFCEQKVELNHVEHYRPKSKYPFFAFSWDNLIIACAHCNIHKDNHFDLHGAKRRFVATNNNIDNINNLGAVFNGAERPKMVNPETTDPHNNIIFSRLGAITSNNPDFSYTIDKCKISRTYLRDERRRVLDKFERSVRAVLVGCMPAEQLTQIEGVIKSFISDSADPDEQFLAFRSFAIQSGWLKDIINEQL